jgi:hypothetical protein
MLQLGKSTKVLLEVILTITYVNRIASNIITIIRLKCMNYHNLKYLKMTVSIYVKHIYLKFPNTHLKNWWIFTFDILKCPLKYGYYGKH